MAGYGAVISFRNTVQHIANSSRLRLVHPSVDILEASWKELQPLQDLLAKLDRTSKSRSRNKINALDQLIKEKLWDFEDLLESLVSNQVISQLQAEPQAESSAGVGERDLDFAPLFSIDLLSLKDDVDSFVQKLQDMTKEYIHELDNMPLDDDDESPISSKIHVIGGGVVRKSKMIGLSDQLEEIKHYLLTHNHVRSHVCTLVGMGGIGKTTLAEEIFKDPSIMSYYDCRIWVNVGRKSRYDQVARSILAQLDPPPNGTAVDDDDHDEKYYNLILKERLAGKKCLIVVDDVWETEVLRSLIKSLTHKGDGITQILLTARGRYVMEKIRSFMWGRDFMVVRFLNEKESKNLLCEKVFGEEICPPQLVKAATKIAKKCEGLPLLIVTVAGILSEAQSNDPEYWDDVAEMRNSVVTDAYNEVSKVLFPSYDYLPQYLKMLFLFLGVFPPDYDIPYSKIINMLTAEGWFDSNVEPDSLALSVAECLDVLYRLQNLIFLEEMSQFRGISDNYRVCKTCRLHSAWRHLCRVEARKINFFHVLNRLVDASEETIKRQRCLCLENNILFAIKEFCKSFCASSIRSLLFFGPYHQYPTPIGVDFKLLRELDALKLRFYSFPIELLTLFQLKYLALTCNGELPTSISKLFNLRVLIIHPHSNIRFCSSPSYIPVQIWEMQELEHIEILGKSLVAPYHIASNLDNLKTLVGVDTSTSSIFQLFKKIPRIEKLDFQIELLPFDNHVDLLSCFCCTSRLESLRTLKCSILNPPVLRPWTSHSLMLPQRLMKLHLSGMGFPWEYMKDIGTLPDLRVLKLRSYAFRGSTWETQEESFPRLGSLVIEDSDLVEWKPRDGSFRELNHLTIKHCYKLEKLQWPSTRVAGKIDFVDCNPLALSCAMHLPLEKDVGLTIDVSISFTGRPKAFVLQRKG